MMSYTVIFYSTLNYGLANLGESFLTPTCFAWRNSARNSLCWGPNPNLLCLAKFCSKFSLLGPPTPTCFAWRNSARNSLCWGPNPNLLCLAKFCSKFSLLGPQPQLALLGEILLEILFVGAPTPTCFVW